MKLSELMNGKTPSPDFEGWVTNDDYVLAVDTTTTGTTAADVGDYAVVEIGVAGFDSALNPVTVEKTYIRAGKSTTKTGTKRSFKVAGDRYFGDDFQDLALSHAIKYGTGNAVIRDYVYFNMLTGEGEKGKVSIIVNNDGSGNAGESASIEIDLIKQGAAPVEYSYSSAG